MIAWQELPAPLRYGFKDPDGTVFASTKAPWTRRRDGWVIDEPAWTVVVDSKQVIGNLDCRTLVVRNT